MPTPPSRHPPMIPAELRSSASPQLEAALERLEAYKLELELQNRELREAAGLLETSRNRYVELWESAPVGNFVFNLVGTIRQVNAFGAALLGQPPERVPGLPLASIVTLADHPGFLAHLARCGVEQREDRLDLSFTRRSGEQIFVRAVSVPGREEDGRAVVRSAFTDVTDRRRSEDLFKLLSDLGTALTLSLDEGSLLERMADLTLTQLGVACLVDVTTQGGGSRRAVTAHRTPELRRTLARLEAQAGLPGFVSLAIERAGAQRAAQLVTLEPAWRDPAWPFSGCLAVPVVARDCLVGTLTWLLAEPVGAFEIQIAEEVARRTAMAVENARLYGAAQAGLRAREEFVSVASHELRTPLTSLELQVEALRRTLGASDTPTPREPILRALDGIGGSTAQLVGLTERLLDVTRIRSGQLRLYLSEVRLAPLVRRVVARLIGGQRQPAPVTLTLDEDVTGRWDLVRVEQVVTNLVSNALKYGGGAAVEVRVSQAEGWAELVVEDAGPGIAPADAERIFWAFERACSADHHGGLGLGLYVTRQIVDALDGGIAVSGRSGGGTCFVVELPLRGPVEPSTED